MGKECFEGLGFEIERVSKKGVGLWKGRVSKS